MADLLTLDSPIDEFQLHLKGGTSIEIIVKKGRKDEHAYFPELKSLFSKGRITRREFLRNATLLGMSAAAAYAATGRLMPNVDEVMYIAMDKDAGMAAMQSGQVDSMYGFRPGDFMALKNNPNVNFYTVDTSYTYVMRMRVDLPPWDDNRVRTAEGTLDM